MSVTETIGGLGSWTVELTERVPDSIRSKLGFFGHIVIVDGPADVAASGQSLLGAARYAGVLRKRDTNTGRVLSGAGMVVWLGDEDGKGRVIETSLNLSGLSFASCVASILGQCPSVTAGSVQALAGTYSGAAFQYVTPRQALQTVCDAFGAEFRVNPNGSVDAGTAAHLYNTEAPRALLIRDGAGSDFDLTALPGRFTLAESVIDHTTKVKLLGQTSTASGGTESFVTATAGGASATYVDLLGNPVVITRMISESGTSEGAASTRAQLQLNRFNRVAKSLALDTGDFEITDAFRPGDNIYVYDPDAGLYDPATQIEYRGETWHPETIRATGMTWSLREGMTVAFRTGAGEWLDLSPYVEWETGSTELTVGDLPRTLAKGGDSLASVRVDVARVAGPDSTIPAAPTGLMLTASSGLDARGRTVSLLGATWNPVALNTDGSAIVDLSHYVFQYRWTARSAWQQVVTDDPSAEAIVAAGLPFVTRVAAVDISGNFSAWSATASITTALDAIAPPAPADPVVTSYLGQLRIRYAGTDALGQPMPTDTNRIEVHVGTTAAFVASNATRVSHINPFAEGVAYATAPYGSLRYVRLIAVDHDGNVSPSSAVISGSTVQVADGDVAAMSVGKLTAGIMTADVIQAGTLYTASFGKRVGFDSTGIKAYDAAENLLVDINGADNLITGKYRNGLPGTRRIEMGMVTSTLSDIKFIAPDGKNAHIGGFSGGTGIEVLRLGVTTTGVSQFWNKVQLQDDGSLYSWSSHHKIVVGGNGPEATKNFTLAWATGRGTPTDSTIPDYYRLIVDEQYNRLNHMSDVGGTLIYDRATNGTFAIRYWVHPGGIDSRIRVEGEGGAPAQSFVVNERRIDDVTFPRFNITKDLVYFEWQRTHSNARIVLDPPNFDGFSPTVQLVNNANFGAGLKFGSNQDGTNYRLEVRDAPDNIFIPVWAQSFVVNSDIGSKTDIADYDGDALAEIRALRLTTFQMKDKAETRKITRREKPDEDSDEIEREYEIRTPTDSRRHLGVVAQQVGDLFARQTDKGMGVDLSAIVYGLVGAVQRLADMMDDQRGGKP